MPEFHGPMWLIIQDEQEKEQLRVKVTVVKVEQFIKELVDRSGPIALQVNGIRITASDGNLGE